MKADTMNIELPPLPESTWHPAPHERAFCPGEVEAYARNAILADRASRSRAASEPGEVARLEEKLRTWFDLNASHEPSRVVLKEDIARLASMATSPASAAQAGWVMVPREPILEMGWAYLEAARKSSPLIEHVFNHPGYRAMLAAAPQPASSPVAAEGQKPTPSGELSDASRLSLLNTLAQHRGFENATKALASIPLVAEGQKAVAGEPHPNCPNAFVCAGRCSGDRCADAMEPTASMADAADAERFRRMAGVVRCSVKGVMLDDTSGIEQWRSAVDRIATPGPRGENAGGVVEALSEEALLEALTGHVNGYITNTVRSIAMDVQRACATAWGLRIAEKGES